MKQVLQPDGWVRPKGYSNGIAATGRMVFTAGVVGWSSQEEFERQDFVGQFDQVLANTVAILAEAGARPEHIVRMTAYLTSKQDYLSNLERIGEVWKARFGLVFPALAFVEVCGLMEDAALIEIETTAMVPYDA